MEVAKEMLMFGVRGFKVGSQLEQVLDEIGSSDLSPEEEKAQKMIQQAQQQAQEAAQELEKRKVDAEKAEASAKDAESQARIAEKQGQLASSNAKNAEDAVKHEAELFKLTVNFQKQIDALKDSVDAMKEAHKQEVHRVLQGAQQAAEEAIDSFNPPPTEEKTPEPKAAPQPPVHLHINDGKMAAERPKRRKLRIVDNPDGSMDVEEGEIPDNEARGQ